jgi:hypothetical protein
MKTRTILKTNKQSKATKQRKSPMDRKPMNKSELPLRQQKDLSIEDIHTMEKIMTTGKPQRLMTKARPNSFVWEDATDAAITFGLTIVMLTSMFVLMLVF